ncbi:N-acetylmuramoyl-L-alanine amidase [Actinoplanes teichomyceticus]|uniref:Uncharacterized protein with LGFP repeats n=1 Tax=Actinoplanes teichomyceticus TaxID=1867 RepID=A0A561VSK7_ACTTI|nr:N-acetylmuramoyl-L-alanine amidase [Actinoplanes teichomyceticus]TWG14581.1 uncharacterized protein with LGFP repeats [Actinoplanes teichomyceticus]GIF09985.1 hypothetical protein Ate01nite_00170 [Actinoplanes teichomyceticus]
MRRNRLVTAMVAATPAVTLAAIGLAPAHDEPLLQTFPLTAPGGVRLVAAADGHRVELPERDTARFSLVGVTWDDPAAAAAGTIQVRTRAAGTHDWTPWRVLETDAPDESGGAEGARVRGASDPLWVGPSDGVQARVVGGDGELPAGLRVDLINPDSPERPRTRMAPAALQRPGRAGAAPLPVRPVPRMLTRSAWGADERIVTGPPGYTGATEVFFVHHTATGNDYSCRSSASIVRGIQAYQVRSKGWNDVGYNFLVDRCGTIFEGRRGGVDRNVLGAHTLGFNTNASSVAVIGDYRSAPVPAAARLSVAQLAAYKLGGAGRAPAGRVVLASGGGPRFAAGRRVLLNRISGHRDAGLTECPGDTFYAQLAVIRRVAGAAPAGLRLRRISGARLWSGRYWTRGPLVPLWDLTTPTRMIDRFDIYVDGRLVLSRANWTRLGRLRLRPGPHTVAVRAVHLSRRTATTTVPVVADVTPPDFTALPRAALTAGTVGSTAPVRLSWAATDPAGLHLVEVTGASRAVLAGAVRSLGGPVPVGRPSTWTVAATDHAGNRRAASFTRTPRILQETAATRTGSWRARPGVGHLGGAAARATSTRSALSWTFTGRSAALVVGRTATSGRIRIYVDGAFQGYADTRATSPLYRRVVWTRAWADAGRHTVRIQPEGTAGRSGVIVDGLAYLS